MKRALALLLLLCTLSLSPVARAQLGQLPVQVPPVGGGPSVGDVVGQTRTTVTDQTRDLGRTATGALRELRRLQIQELLRDHPRELEADPAGQPIVRGQILALGMSAAAIERARQAGFNVVRTDPLDGGAMVTLRAPSGMPTRRALRALREADPQGVYDFDHLHLESGAALSALAFAQAGAARDGPRIGLIDSGVASSVSVAGQQSFVGNAPVAGAHGTTIASMLRSAAPGARIYAADIYGGAPTGGASSALARALAWLASQNTPVINVSLVGPRNRIVEAVVQRLIARGFIIVAAVGNDGPAAAPLYPAAYDGVVGVTGVDARERALVEAGRGAQVDFAALGIHGQARGTSYAAPIVAARLALSTNAASAASAQGAITTVRNEARDLGARGRDDIYGYGLIAAH